jgi:hypothetical protein
LKSAFISFWEVKIQKRDEELGSNGNKDIYHSEQKKYGYTEFKFVCRQSDPL